LDRLAKSKMKNINCREMSKVRDTGLFIDGRDYYRAFCAASESAERHILRHALRYL
jgi:hypothetical protein